MRLIVCAFLSCCLSSGLKAQTLPDSIQQQLDSLAVEMQEAPDSLMAALYYQSARPVYDYLALQSDSITKANWPAENLMLLKMADTLSAQSKDSLTLRKSLILLTNAYYWFKDTVQAQDYFWRYKAMCASHGYFVENGPKGEGFEYSRISHSIMIFEDSTQALSIEEISSPERQDDFRLNPFQIERYLPVRDRVIWAKIRLRSRAERDNDYFFMVGFENYSWREIEIFLPDSSGQFQRLTTGFFTPPEEKPIEDWRNYFSVFIPRKGEKTLYFRLSNPSRLGTPYNVLLYQTNREEIQAKESRNQHINGVFQGVVLVQGLFFLFWFFSTRSRVYLYYVFYLLSLALMALTVNYYLVLVPSYPDLRYIIFTVMIFIAALGFLLFSFSLLRVAERPAGKRWERILWVGFALMLVCLVLNTSANIYRYELLT
ncbi:MAG: 7TM-DISM domain-containing protein, partial [Bacteroidota bacterium]